MQARGGEVAEFTGGLTGLGLDAFPEKQKNEGSVIPPSKRRLL
jgi:hypothetical protein